MRRTRTTPPGFADRKNLTAKLSCDECQTWPASRSLEPGPSGYSDLGIAGDGTILCVYESGSLSRMTDNLGLSVAKFNLEWVTQGQDAPAG